ncbi:MAG: hypothetical protein DCC74_00475 [Proteobacteria bacterium]|nr:MAG: hypothetical protein DCC74_00475 [Pseudomonadota bacterium]
MFVSLSVEAAAMSDMGRVQSVPDIWLSGLVAALEAMARAPAPPAETVEACRKHLAGVPSVLCGAPETMPGPLPGKAELNARPPRPALETTH